MKNTYSEPTVKVIETSLRKVVCTSPSHSEEASSLSSYEYEDW